MINQREIWLLIIGAGISLISSIAVFILQSTYQTVLNKKGEIKIYKKLVYSKLDQLPWGLRTGNFSVPLWIELQNTKNQNEMVRNINLVLFKDNNEVALMTQVSHYETDDSVYHFANNGSYSIILKPNTIEKLDLYFTIKNTEHQFNFDEVRLRYYDTNDSRKEFQLLKINNPKNIKKTKIDDDWSLLEK